MLSTKKDVKWKYFLRPSICGLQHMAILDLDLD